MEAPQVIPLSCGNWAVDTTPCANKGWYACGSCNLVVVSPLLNVLIPFDLRFLPALTHITSIAERTARKHTGRNTKRPASLLSARRLGAPHGNARIENRPGLKAPLEQTLTTRLAEASFFGETPRRSISSISTTMKGGTTMRISPCSSQVGQHEWMDLKGNGSDDRDHRSF